LANTRTLTIIKPDGVQQNNIGDIIRSFEQHQLKIVAMKMLHLTKKQAEGFYAVHRERPFFDSLTTFMSSGRVVVMVLEGDNVITRLRELIEQNVIHGSDAPETAAFEISYFFSELEISK